MQFTRRRFIAITAAAGGLPLLPIAAARADERLRVWSGTALGCDATLQIHHPDAATADRLIAASLAEVERAFRCLKRIDLLVRSIRHRPEDRVPARSFCACWPTMWNGICAAPARHCCSRMNSAG